VSEKNDKPTSMMHLLCDLVIPRLVLRNYGEVLLLLQRKGKLIA